MREVLVARVELHGYREESEHRKRQDERDEGDEHELLAKHRPEARKLRDNAHRRALVEEQKCREERKVRAFASTVHPGAAILAPRLFLLVPPLAHLRAL